ncbi:hypothetical protein [Microbulbifer sp. JMSA002]|uniref:hypothetical protein n=1 Tax=Microbulbifer sp. JMSA002 TaxID=3243368 RepID=UPI00403A47BF
MSILKKFRKNDRMFCFWVGTPTAIYNNTFDISCKKTLEQKLNLIFNDIQQELCCSHDCSWNDLGKPYNLLKPALGKRRTKKIEYSEGFIPLDIEYQKLKLNIFNTKFLKVSSHPQLSHDTELPGKKRHWPTLSNTDNSELHILRSNESLFYDDCELYTYCKLLVAIKEANIHGLLLWVS